MLTDTHCERDSDVVQLSIAGWASAPTGRRPQRVRFAALLSADVLALGVVVALALRLDRPGSIALLALIFAGMFAYLAVQGHYRRRDTLGTETRELIEAAAIALIGGVMVEAFVLGSATPFRALAAWLLFPLLAIVARQLARLLLRRSGVWRKPIVVVGTGVAAQRAVAALQSHVQLGYDVVASVDPLRFGAVNRIRGWRSVLQSHKAELLVFAPGRGEPITGSGVGDLVRERVPFAIMADFAGLPVVGRERIPFAGHDTLLLACDAHLPQPFARAGKIALDLTLAAAALVVLAPLFLLIAVAIKCDGGPVFFAHQRVGANGRSFGCLKFRSMVVSSDAVLRHALAADPAMATEWRAVRKLRNDPRITWIGRFLRTSSLDELPQLLNVLRLDMSLVGPRPIVQSEVASYAEEIAHYYNVRPGLTGLWQVSGRSDTTYAYRVQLDSWYVRNWSLWHDLAIIARTIPAVLARKGAI